MTRHVPTALGLIAALALAPAGARAQTTVHHHHHHGTAGGQAAATKAATRSDPAARPTDSIVAVVNGDAITASDVTNREKLFALSTGMQIDPAVLARLRPQITAQLIDEKLRTQEMQRRKIVIKPEQISKAIAGIESRNGMKPHALEDKLAQQDVAQTTLIDQIRAQIGWEYILRGDLGPRARVTPHEIDSREELLKQEQGQPEYNISEIFIPVDDPTRAADAEHFASSVISQLRAGAAFGVVAAQFGQGQAALDGGQLGWVQATSLDPSVVSVLGQMPIGAVSNPIRVAGGYDIVTLHGKRTVGNQIETVLHVREAFFPFSSNLDPQHPTAQQQSQLALARKSVNASCEAIEATAKQQGEARPTDPGPLVLATLNPQMQSVLAAVPAGGTTKPLVSLDGIAVIGVCAKDQENLAQETRDQIANALLNERVDLAARQESRDLHRRAVIDDRAS